jgi:hypothetical protein
MKSLDADLAGAFEDYVAFIATYECYPFHGSIRPSIVSERNISILQEIGFLNYVSPHSFVFRDFEMEFVSRRALPYQHGTIGLTHRSSELANSLFAPPPFETTWKSKVEDTKQKVITYAGFVEAAVTVGPRPIILTFGSREQSGFEAMLDTHSQLPAIYCEDGPAITRLLGEYGLAPSELQQGLLETLQQRGIKVGLRRLPPPPPPLNSEEAPVTPSFVDIP